MNSPLPSKAEVVVAAKEVLTGEHITIATVNSDEDIAALLDSSGQLKLRTPLNIFIGGQVLLWAANGRNSARMASASSHATYIETPDSEKTEGQLGQTTVKDKEQDLTREPEMVKAYRDTWTLGLHSYLAYLRDRLQMARELLADSGSVFVQISDENLHRVRSVMDEVFGPKNFVSVITVAKTAGASSDLIPGICDFLLWYARDITKMKYRQLFRFKGDSGDGADEYRFLSLPDGSVRSATAAEIENAALIPAGASRFRPSATTSQRPPGSDPFEFQERTFTPSSNQFWKTSVDSLRKLGKAERLLPRGTSVSYLRKLDGFPVLPVTNLWTDTRWGFDASEKLYVVQTNPRIVERGLLMTTDPGDLVLDPTCGSGTTAYVAEQWGRRWITCDSSRVALALAKHRLMTAKFDYQQLRPLSAEDVARNPHGTWLTDPTGKVPGKATFACKTVPHITLKSIARNTSLDPIFAKHEPILAEKLIHKHRESGANAVTDADTRRWLLPDTQAVLIRSLPAKKPFKGVTTKQADAYRAAIPKGGWKEWEVPFDTDADWPKPLQDALTAYRAAWRAKMDEVNACIAAARADFAFESTLSGLTYAKRLKKWKAAGYRVEIVFLRLASVRLALRRIANRVKQGGHHVPAADVRRRFHRGWNNFETTYRTLADAWAVYDNSAEQFKLIEEGP